MELAERVKFLEKNTHFGDWEHHLAEGGLLAIGVERVWCPGGFLPSLPASLSLAKYLAVLNIRIQRDLRCVRHYFATLPDARE